MKGSIEVIAGCMFSGKTEELIRRLRRATIARKSVLVFKPKVDDRYSALDITTHDGRSLTSIPVTCAKDIFRAYYLHPDAPDVVGIDEAQFFGDDLVDVARRLASQQGVRTLIAGLDMTSDGTPFGCMPQLMAIADEVTKLHAVCTECGEPAMFSQRLVTSQEIVLVGGQESYAARCRIHWGGGHGA
jgi:thymidine kinase